MLVANWLKSCNDTIFYWPFWLYTDLASSDDFSYWNIDKSRVKLKELKYWQKITKITEWDCKITDLLLQQRTCSLPL